MIDVNSLQSTLEDNFAELELFILQEVESTSSFLKQQAKHVLKPSFCIAAKQTAGYGQRQRSWCSNQNSITFSLLLHFNVPLHQLDGLPQLTILKIIEGLVNYSSAEFKVKWPNDLYVNNAKAGGILIESVANSATDCWLVIGVGLNSDESLSVVDSYSSETTTVGSLQVSSADTTDAIVSMLRQLLPLASHFKQDLFKQYSNNYRLVDFFKVGQSVFVYDSAIKQVGCYQGLTYNGELLVEIEDKLHTFRSGDVSIRPMGNTDD